MFKDLENFKEKGSFTFSVNEELSQKCNAPKDSSGIYLIYSEEEEYDNLIYIGYSGKEGENGEIKHAEEGMYGSLVNENQFGLVRSLSWPLKMFKDEIETLLVKWYVTYDENDNRFPQLIEEAYLDLYDMDNYELPLWHEQS